MNGCPEVYDLLDRILIINDSIMQQEAHAQLDELRTQYEVDKHIAEKKITRQQLTIAIGACVFLLIIIGIYFFYSRRLKLKNKSLFRQIQELSRAEKAAEEQLLKTPEEQLSREMQLFRRLSAYMQDEKLFTAPDLNRRKLADMLNTNETYIADAIREVSDGGTFSSYVSELRLQYSLHLLNERPELPLDAVAFESGHGSYSPFFRAFTKKYGISPSEYRKISLTKKVER